MEKQINGSPIEPAGPSESTVLSAPLHPLYTATGEISSDPAGVLYRARYEAEARKVLVKELTSGLMADPALLRDAPPGTLKLLDMVTGVHKSTLLVLEYPKASALKRVLARQGNMTVRPSLAVAAQVLKVLRRLHDQDRIFGNLNPGGLFLVRSSSGNLNVRIAYLGLLDTAQPLNAEGYLPPKATVPGYRPSSKDDLWAAAALLYEMLFGLVPFASGTNEASGKPSLFIPPAFLEANADLSKALRRALHPEPSERYSSAEALSAALTGKPMSAVPKPPPVPVSGTGAVGGEPADHEMFGGRTSVPTVPSPPRDSLVHETLPADKKDSPVVVSRGGEPLFSDDEEVTRPYPITELEPAMPAAQRREPSERKRRSVLPWIAAAAIILIGTVSVWAWMRGMGADEQSSGAGESIGDANRATVSPALPSASVETSNTQKSSFSESAVELQSGENVGEQDSERGEVNRDKNGADRRQAGARSRAHKKKKTEKTGPGGPTDDLSSNPFPLKNNPFPVGESK